MNARRTILNLTYNSTDISQDLAPHILAFTFTDNSGGKADDLSLSLEDRDNTWLNDWTPSKADTLTASIINVTPPVTSSLPCGTFAIDQLDYTFPPATLSIKAVSSHIAKHISQQKHTRFWEGASLSGVAADIAAMNGLTLFIQHVSSPTLERIDQTEQTDLEFLQNFADDFGAKVKVQASTLILYNVDERENSQPITTLTLDNPKLLSCKFTSKAAKVYRSAHVSYHDPLKDADFDAYADDDSVEGSDRTLEIHERMESQAQAQQVAKQRLLAANRSEVTGTLTLMGDTRFLAGVTLTLEDFGNFTGKYFVTKATHKVDRSGYTTTLELGQPPAAKTQAKTRKAKRQARPKTQSTELYYTGDKYYHAHNE